MLHGLADINPSLSLSVLTDGNLMERLVLWQRFNDQVQQPLCINVSVMALSHSSPLKRKKSLVCLFICFAYFGTRHQLFHSKF
jgi:hypothetical protein